MYMNLVITSNSLPNSALTFSQNLTFGQVPVVSTKISQSLLDPMSQTEFNWGEKEFRDSVVGSSVDHTIAQQIKLNRESRGWNQAQLAELLGTQQSAVARMEDPMYGSYSINSLKKIASIFDCGLVVRFVSHDAVANLLDHVSPPELTVHSFSEIAAQNILPSISLESANGR